MVGMTVGDMDRSVEFYTSVLDFRVVSDDEAGGASYDSLQGLSGTSIRVVRLKLGDEYLQLTQYLSPRGGRRRPTARSNDRWFQHVAIIVSDMDSAYARLRRFKVRQASTGPQLLPKTIPNAAGIRAFYFRDPDGHPLEVLQFPPDKGDPKWHAPTDRLFLGIDHTAIVVGDTEREPGVLSRRARLPGRRREHELRDRAGAPEQRGGRPAAHHRPSRGRGPGHRVPRVSRARRTAAPIPRTSARTTWCTGRRPCWCPTLTPRPRRSGEASSASSLPTPVELPDTALGFTRGVLVRDPDGHAVQLVEHQGGVHAQH